MSPIYPADSSFPLRQLALPLRRASLNSSPLVHPGLTRHHRGSHPTDSAFPAHRPLTTPPERAEPGLAHHLTTSHPRPTPASFSAFLRHPPSPHPVLPGKPARSARTPNPPPPARGTRETLATPHRPPLFRLPKPAVFALRASRLRLMAASRSPSWRLSHPLPCAGSHAPGPLWTVSFIRRPGELHAYRR